MAINSITNSVAAQQASTYTAAKTDYTKKKKARAAQRQIPVSYMRRVLIRHPAQLQRKPITHLSTS